MQQLSQDDFRKILATPRPRSHPQPQPHPQPTPSQNPTKRRKFDATPRRNPDQQGREANQALKKAILTSLPEDEQEETDYRDRALERRELERVEGVLAVPLKKGLDFELLNLTKQQLALEEALFTPTTNAAITATTTTTTATTTAAPVEPTEITKNTLGAENGHFRGLIEQIQKRAMELETLRFSQPAAYRDYLLGTGFEGEKQKQHWFTSGKMSYRFDPNPNPYGVPTTVMRSLAEIAYRKKRSLVETKSELEHISTFWQDTLKKRQELLEQIEAAEKEAAAAAAREAQRKREEEEAHVNKGDSDALFSDVSSEVSESG